MKKLVEGIMAHRAFSRRSASDYKTRLRNAEHYACVRDGDRWIIEPLGWALLAARGGDIVHSSRGKSLAASDFQAMRDEGWVEIGPEHQQFDAFWEDLLVWCRTRDTAPSARTGRSSKEDRTFWLPPT